ncbi:MAG: alginate export family protein [Candidatus Desulfofervidaceae bacterium]|nr:alginate export family protein [Candidatus Desulfofervidaceae bacterium]
MERVFKLVIVFLLFPTLLYAGGLVVAENSYFKVNFEGQVRTRYELKGDYYAHQGSNLQQGMQKDTQDYFLIRTRLGLDIQGQDWGIYLMGQQAEDINGRELDLGMNPTSQDFDMDIQQLYFYLNKPGNSPISIWFGCKEVRYDREALIGTSVGWGNYVRSYDGGMVSLDLPELKLDCFYLQNRHFDKENFDNWFDSPHFYGYWFTYKNFPQAKIDQYFLVNDKKGNDDVSYTLGLRLYKKKTPPFDFDISFVYQWGTFVGAQKLDRRAYAVHAEAGYKFIKTLKQRIGIEYNYASGDDDPNDDDYGTFDKLYGCDHGKYGLMDFFTWKNMHEIQLNHTLFLKKGMKFKTMLHAFWLDTTKDAWYDFTGKAVRQAASGQDVDSYVGTELDFLFSYKMGQHWHLNVFYGHFFAGSYVEDTAATSDAKDDADYAYLELRFNW